MQDLIEENELGNSLLFVIGAIRHFLDIPILLILPKVKDDAAIAGGKVFLFERCHLYQEDQFLSKEEFKIKLMFNGWDYVCPMIQDDIGEIMSYAAPTLEKVQNAHSIIQKLSEKVPNQNQNERSNISNGNASWCCS